MQVGRGLPSIYGIQLTMVPGDAAYGVEIWRGSDSSAPGTPPTTNLYGVLAGPIAVPAGGTVYLDALPLDGFKRYYQARQVSYTNTNDTGPFTASTTGHTPTAINANPLLAFSPLPSVYPLNRAQKMNDAAYAMSAADTGGQQPTSNVYVPASQKIRVGTPSASSFYTHTLVLGPASFRGATTNDIVIVTAGQLQNGTTARVSIRAGVFLPINAIPSAVRWTAFQSSGTTAVGQANQFSFIVVTYPSSSGNYTIPRTFGIALGGGYGSFSSSGWTEGAAGSVTIAYGALSSEVYVLEGTLGCTSMASGAMLNRVEIDYTLADYSIGY